MATTTDILYVDFLCFKVDAAFRRLPAQEIQKAKKELEEFLKEAEKNFNIRPYLTIGLRQEVDFFLWLIAEDLAPVQSFIASLYRTVFGKYLSLVYSFVAMKKPSPYALPHQQAFEKDDPPKKYLFVYPFVKSREWYLLPFEKRKAIMEEHTRIAREYATVRLNTTYSFGLGDQEFVLAFEADVPADFENLVQRLRETEGSRYVIKDTPLIIGTVISKENLFERLGL